MKLEVSRVRHIQGQWLHPLWQSGSGRSGWGRGSRVSWSRSRPGNGYSSIPLKWCNPADYLNLVIPAELEDNPLIVFSILSFCSLAGAAMGHCCLTDDHWVLFTQSSRCRKLDLSTSIGKKYLYSLVPLVWSIGLFRTFGFPYWRGIFLLTAGYRGQGMMSHNHSSKHILGWGIIVHI